MLLKKLIKILIIGIHNLNLPIDHRNEILVFNESST